MKRSFLALILVLCLSIPVFAGLEGKIIVVNSGHGGGERGAIGLNGLEEGKINLIIGLHLRDLLEQAGATVIMARVDDSDLDGTSHYSGSRDRLNRLRLGREYNADIFLELHHNASINREANQIEIYYQPKYHGPSKSLAEYINEGLKETMELGGITTTMSHIVLNQATIPTIIGEAGYISNPAMEAWLSKEENLKKVAEGYFIGVKKFFEDGMPVVTILSPEVNQKVIHKTPMIMARISTDGTSPIDPDSIQVRVNNVVIPHDYDLNSGRITAKVTKSLSNGMQRMLITGKNMVGTPAVPADYIFYVDEKPAQIVLDSYPTIVPGVKETVVKISGQVLDKDGQPVLDGNQVYFDLNYDGTLAEPWVFTRNGYFDNYLQAPGKSNDIAAIRIWTGGVMEEIVVDFRGKDLYRYGVVRDSLTGRPLPGIEVKLVNPAGEYVTQTDRDGYYFFSQVKHEHYNLIINQPGYDFYMEFMDAHSLRTGQQSIQIVPIAGGVLNGKRIVLNSVVEGTIPGADSIIYLLQIKLERAGVEVFVVNEGEDDRSTVSATNELMGNFLLSIMMTTDKTGKVYHYPRNQKHEAIAKNLKVEEINFEIDSSRSRLITGANTHSFIVEIPQEHVTQYVVDGLYQFIVDYFKGD